jgi:hypothetical protein
MDIFEQLLQAAHEAGAHVIVGPLPDEVGPGITVEHRGRPVILLLEQMHPVDRLCTLAHEVAHVQRGGGVDLPGAPASWGPVVARDEAATEMLAATQLVPPAALSAWVDAQADVGEAVGPMEVAQEWGVSVRLAITALAALTMWERRTSDVS